MSIAVIAAERDDVLSRERCHLSIAISQKERTSFMHVDRMTMLWTLFPVRFCATEGVEKLGPMVFFSTPAP